MPYGRRGRGRPPGPAVDPQQRREELLDAAERAVRSSGIDVALADIAAEAHLTRSAVYAAFVDRDALIDALAQRHSAKLIERLAQIPQEVSDPREQTRASIELLAVWFDDDPALARLLADRIDAPREGGSGVIARALADILRAGFAARNRDAAGAEPWAHFLIGGIGGGVRWWTRARVMTRDELVDHLTDLVWEGFSGAGADGS